MSIRRNAEVAIGNHLIFVKADTAARASVDARDNGQPLAMRDILVYADNYTTWTRSMIYASELALLARGALTAAFVAEPFVPMPSMSLPVFPEVYSYTAQLVSDARAAELAFLAEAKKRGVAEAKWLVIEGNVAPALAYAGNWHDLLVLESGQGSAWRTPGVLGHIVLTCGVPSIVVPETFQRKASLDTIAIAWNGSAEAIRALHCALPLLVQATKVVLIQGQREDPFSSIECMPAFRVEEWLDWRRIPYENVPFAADDRQAGNELLRVADNAKADLLVMGAYGHTRLSEWVLGGATRQILEHAGLPVFMRH